VRLHSVGAKSLDRRIREENMNHSGARLPDDAFDYAFYGYPFETALEQLASLAAPEVWGLADDKFSILGYYFATMWQRVVELDAVAEVDGREGPLRVWHTNLVTSTGEDIFAVLRPNYPDKRQPWRLWNFTRRSDRRIVSHGALLPRPNPMFDYAQPETVFDPNLPVELSLDHSLLDHPDRFGTIETHYEREVRFHGAVELAKRKAALNYRHAVASRYYDPKRPGSQGRIQLLLPLSFDHEDRVDQVLVLERTEGSDGSDFYLAPTALPPQEGYRRARTVARPSRDWLSPPDPPSGADTGPGGFRRAFSYDRCPVCGGSGGCVLAASNRTAYCRNVESPTRVRTVTGAEVFEHELEPKAAGFES